MAAIPVFLAYIGFTLIGLALYMDDDHAVVYGSIGGMYASVGLGILAALDVVLIFAVFG